MKRIIICLTILFSLITLGACANRDDKRTPDHRTDTIYEDGNLGREKTKYIPKEGKPHPTPDDKSTSEGYLPNDIAILEEIPTISHYLPLENLVADVESDIPNKRIILFQHEEESDQVYKSIFMKSDQFLQIVDFNKDEIIYEGHLSHPNN